ncbi:hypothetical protein ACFQY7_36180 [Actinomadura luteofluorescens]|uniref:hypothetical protein n=1 Tax=Actinomadura luteofluorescens TaxID=46163 RepID=UPI0036268F97
MHSSRSRRQARAVIVSALLAATALSPVTPALAATASPASCSAPGYTTFGPASLTGAIVGATVLDGKAYVVTRGLKPPLLAEIDLATRKVVREVRLPDAPAAGEAEEPGPPPCPAARSTSAPTRCPTSTASTRRRAR